MVKWLGQGPPRWNGAPSQELLVIRRNHRIDEGSMDPLRWGLKFVLDDGAGELVSNESGGSEARGRRGLGKVMPLLAKNRAVLYRQRAQECLDLARTLTFGTERQILIDMAQTWLELAEEQEAEMPSGSDQAVMQQQQQAQPKNDDKEE